MLDAGSHFSSWRNHGFGLFSTLQNKIRTGHGTLLLKSYLTANDAEVAKELIFGAGMSSVAYHDQS